MKRIGVCCICRECKEDDFKEAYNRSNTGRAGRSASYEGLLCSGCSSKAKNNDLIVTEYSR